MKIVAFILCLGVVTAIAVVLFVRFAVAKGEIEAEKWRAENGDERE